jgi:membrane protein DedA with SNARE-associated domain
MKHPIHFVVLAAGSCIASAFVVFLAGVATQSLPLKTAGLWFAIAAFVIACLPLISVIAVLAIEQLRRK